MLVCALFEEEVGSEKVYVSSQMKHKYMCIHSLVKRLTIMDALLITSEWLSMDMFRLTVVLEAFLVESILSTEIWDVQVGAEPLSHVWWTSALCDHVIHGNLLLTKVAWHLRWNVWKVAKDFLLERCKPEGCWPVFSVTQV